VTANGASVRTASGRFSAEGIALGALFALVGVLGVAYGARSWFPELASQHGVGIDAMLNYLLVSTGGLFLVGHLVLALFIWQGTRRSHVSRRSASPKAERRLSVALGMLMALIAEGGVLAIGIPVWGEYFMATPPDDAVVIEVTGTQFMWHSRYPGPDGQFGRLRPELVDSLSNPIGLDGDDGRGADDVVWTGEIYAPVDRTILIRLRSSDVIHSLFVPALRVKQDVVPGMTPEVLFVATREGRFEIACTELCGMGHYRMQGFFNVVSDAEFDRWLAEQGS
jgi:cytochrome c oxidase subunit II